MIIGIIGKVGSGKSLCTEILDSAKRKDVFILSADNMAKEMIQNKEVDFAVSNTEDFFRSEALQEECREKVHKKVFDKIFRIIDKKKNLYNIFIIETALPSIDFMEKCDKVICIENSLENKANLLKTKRNYDIDKINLILDSQKYYDKFYDKADYIIENNGTKEDLSKKFLEVIDEIFVIRK